MFVGLWNNDGLGENVEGIQGGEESRVFYLLILLGIGEESVRKLK